MTGIESSISTGEPQLSSPEPSGSSPEPSLSPLPVARERCAMCGATLAADQRYCVECGQRCGSSRLPFSLTDASSQSAQPKPSSAPRARKPRASVNATLIAGIGTLLLALGIGVLIGKLGSDSNSSKPAVQVVTVAGGGGTAGTAGATAGAESSPTSSAATGAAKTGAAAAAAKSAKSAGKAPPVPPVKVVKVGSKGSGPGYQHGHFTGNFFGN